MRFYNLSSRMFARGVEVIYSMKKAISVSVVLPACLKQIFICIPITRLKKISGVVYLL